MPTALPVVYLARHGQTAWSLSGQHTGLTDIPLTPHGEEEARRLGERLRDLKFARVFTSPLIRAHHTCEIAGFGAGAQIDQDLVEWNYGKYEGLKSDAIHQLQPGWQIFRDGCPGGESIADMTARADRVVAKLRSQTGDVLVFSSGHILRSIAARWCGWDLSAGAHLFLATATVSILGFEHTRDDPAIRLWNDGH